MSPASCRAWRCIYESIGRFFVDYPDGRLISILRDPADWFASRRAHTKAGIARYDDVEKEIDLWNRMARTALHYQSKYGDQRFMLLSFRGPGHRPGRDDAADLRLVWHSVR